MTAAKRVMIGVSEEVHTQIVEASECLGCPEDKEPTVKRTADRFLNIEEWR